MKPTLLCQRLGPGDGLVEHFHHQDAEDDECELLRGGHLPLKWAGWLQEQKLPGVCFFDATCQACFSVHTQGSLAFTGAPKLGLV